MIKVDRNHADTQARKLASHPKIRTLGATALIVKRLIDIVGALVFFILFGPIYACVWVAIAVTMGRPVHYWQIRLGLGGRRFKFYKFRSLSKGSDAVLNEYLTKNESARAEWDTFQRLEKDPRITPLGCILRKSSLDELPQFWNVLRGDMSLVGPRPCMERQRPLYGAAWEQYCLMRPGITGLWQVSGRYRLSYAQRVQLDKDYVENWSLWLDFRILFRTIAVVFRGEG